METFESITQIKEVKKNCVLTIGNFDGVHVGHQAILSAANTLSAKLGTETVALTFEPHPVALLFPEKAPAILTPLPLKKILLEQQKINNLIVLKDSLDLLQLSPTDFVDKFLIKFIKPSVIVEGETFNFGQNRSGSVHTLAKLGEERGFKVSMVPQKEVRLSNGQPSKVSSSIIRNLLRDGNVTDAAIALDKPYRLIGPIISGKGKGRHLGFPTLNMGQTNQLIPAEGVYAGFVELGDTYEQVIKSRQKLPAIFSIGHAKTFGSVHPLLIEAHLFIENTEVISGKWMAMDFVKYIRPQQKFTAESELAAQIAKDCRTAKKILNLLK